MEPPADQSWRSDARITDLIVRLAVLGVFVYWSLTLLRPFLPVFTWAMVLTVALFPAYVWLARALGGRRGLAALLTTLAALLVVVGPVAALVASFVETLTHLVSGLHDGTLRLPPPPPGIATWPLMGDSVERFWSLASVNLETAIQTYRPVLAPVLQRVLATLSAVGGDILLFVVAVILSGFLFKPGQSLAAAGRQVAGRIIAPRGAMFVDMAGATIRNVSRGVVGVALLQAILAGVILQIAQVPGAGLIAFVLLLLCLIQIGPLLVVVPAVIWAWFAMPTIPALFFTLAMATLPLLDNILKPVLMARGLKTPTPVIFLGVIGGTLSHGLIGLFLGPVILAVFYDLLVAWARFGTAPSAAESPSSATDTS